MTTLTAKDALWSALYLGGSECTLPARLLTYFPEDIRTASFDLLWVADRLEEFSNSTVQAESDTDRAIGILIRTQAGSMSTVLRDPVARRAIDAHIDYDRGIQSAFESTSQFLESNNLEFADPVVRIVDRFPQPYQDRKYAILTADAGDQRKYGVAPGLYLARGHVRPFYTESLTCHELIHVALGSKSPELMGRGLEEGIAELLGSMILSSKQVGITPTFWIGAFTRHTSVYSLFWEHYNDFLRMAYLLYIRFGLGYLVKLLANGREAIKSVEQDMLSGVVPQVGFDVQIPIDAEIAGLVDRLVLGFARSMIVTPIARVVADYAFVGSTAKEITSASGLSEDSVLASIEELTESAVVIGRRRDGFIVTSSDLPMYLASGMLRYSLP